MNWRAAGYHQSGLRLRFAAWTIVQRDVQFAVGGGKFVPPGVAGLRMFQNGVAQQKVLRLQTLELSYKISKVFSGLFQSRPYLCYSLFRKSHFYG
jgi:hypothetical protein